MKLSESRYEVVIAGGGMVGASLAIGLSRVLGPERRILLIESFALPGPGSVAAPYSPSFDSRATALSRSSLEIYEQLGLWDALAANAEPIRQIHVSDRGRFGSTLLAAEEFGWEALGYVVENAWLGQVLIDQLHRENGVELASPASVTGIEPSGKVVVEIQLGEQQVQIECGLLVVADGANSQLRSMLGVQVEQSEYGQDALIANVGISGSHDGVAFERFTDTGPVALLPLVPDAEGSCRSALVWTMPRNECAALLDLDDDEFLACLQQRFGYRLGRLQRVGVRSSYPLSLIRAREQVRRGVVVMGNAAHSLHPVAGQGYNLALRDIQALCQVLGNAAANGSELGEFAVLNKYVGHQAVDQDRTILFSDRVTGVFSNSDPALGLVRDLGLVALDIVPGLKRQFVAQAAGISGLRGGGGYEPG